LLNIAKLRFSHFYPILYFILFSPCQGKGRGFESRPALTKSLDFQGIFCCADMCTICALLFLVLFIAIIQSFIHNIQVLLFRIGIVNVIKSSPFIDLSKNIPYFIQGHSFRTQAACSCPSCAMRTFVCNSCISAIFTKPIGYCSCSYSLPISFKDKFTFGIKLSGFSYDIFCYVCNRDKAVLLIIFLF